MSDEKNEKGIDVVVGGFFERTQKFWLILIASLLAVAIIVGLVLFIDGNKTKKGVSFLDEATYELMTSKANDSEEEYSVSETSFMENVSTFAKKNGNNSITARAYMMLAQLYFDKEDWENSLTNWINAGECGKSYLSGISYYNAGVCYEQKGDVINAEKMYSKAVEVKAFDLKSHALFSLARVLETEGKVEEALVQYNKLCDEYDDSWADLAKSRIIALNTDKE